MGAPRDNKRRGCIKWVAIIGIIAVIVIVLGSFGGCLVNRYNSMVGLQEDVKNKWGNIESQLQRRGDLIGNLVATVKRYAEHEEEVFIEVAKARSSLNNAATPDEYAQASGELSNALSRLMVVVEQYPELKANQNFLDLQAQIEGTENRINYARIEYNESVRIYNTYIKRFPANIIAKWYDFTEWQFFEAEEEAREVPDVEELFDR
ncbi:LemA family protein [candidate division WOR-3 bacterium]|nr:LemA family protein [candidate division WOR-3 bacterium]